MVATVLAWDSETELNPRFGEFHLVAADVDNGHAPDHTNQVKAAVSNQILRLTTTRLRRHQLPDCPHFIRHYEHQ